MRILVLHASRFASVGAIRDYLLAYQAESRHEVMFLEAGDGAVPVVDPADYDAVIVNFCCRLHYGSLFSEASEQWFAAFPGLKAIILQDEQENTLAVRNRILRMRPHIVFTTVTPKAWPLIFPEDQFAGIRMAQLMTGYSRPGSLPKSVQIQPLAERPTVLGYRVTPQVWRWGEKGYLKVEIGRRMLEACKARSIAANIAWTEEAKIYGDAWLAFNASCRSVLGSPTGADIFDWHGDLQRREVAFRERRPEATYNDFISEIGAQPVPFETGQLSPRVFEATLTQTSLVMIRSSYSGILNAEEHYIPVEPDFSNVDEVLDRMMDLDALTAMAQRAYVRLIESSDFTFKALAARIDTELEQEMAPHQNIQPLNVRAPLPPILSFLEAKPQATPLGAEHALEKLRRFSALIPDLVDVDQLPAGTPIVVYGGGGGGRIVKDWLSDKGRKVSCFVDSYQEGDLDGIPIIKVNRARYVIDNNYYIIIASQYYFDISNKIISMGFKKIINGWNIIREKSTLPSSVFPYNL